MTQCRLRGSAISLDEEYYADDCEDCEKKPPGPREGKHGSISLPARDAGCAMRFHPGRHTRFSRRPISNEDRLARQESTAGNGSMVCVVLAKRMIVPQQKPKTTAGRYIQPSSTDHFLSWSSPILLPKGSVITAGGQEL